MAVLGREQRSRKVQGADADCLAVHKVTGGEPAVFVRQVAAACCGMYGFRASHGVVPMEGVASVTPSLEAFAWTAADAATLQQVGAALQLPGAACALWSPRQGVREHGLVVLNDRLPKGRYSAFAEALPTSPRPTRVCP